MASTTNKSGMDSIVGVLAPAVSAALSLVEVWWAQDTQEVQIACDPVQDPAGAYRQRFRITRVSNPALLNKLAGRLRHGPVNFELTFAGRTRPATLQRVNAATVQLSVEDIAVLTLTSGGDSEGSSRVAGVDDLIIVTIFVIVVTVALVGTIKILVDASAEGCEIEGEVTPPPAGAV